MKMCSYEHIKIHFAAPYTPQQNGGAERTNRTLQDMARAVLLGSQLDGRQWGGTWKTAAYISNQVLRRKTDRTPYEICIGRIPKVSHRCRRWLTNDKLCHKFDAKTEDAFIIGFTQRSNTYKVLTEKDQMFKITCDIIVRKHLVRESQPISRNKVVQFLLDHNQSTNKGATLSNTFFHGFVRELRAESNQPLETSSPQ